METGKCRVPLWDAYGPAGLCGNEAYGPYVHGPEFRDAYTGELRRFDGKFNGYAPGDWACPIHSGPDKPKE